MPEKVKLLYVDDEEINLTLLRINLSRNYEVLTSLSGIQGLEILNNNPEVKVIISDMRMPGMNGIEFSKKVKEKYPDKKFYILTGYDITPEIQDALKNKLIVKYFRKPFNLNEIEIALSDVIKSH